MGAVALLIFRSVLPAMPTFLLCVLPILITSLSEKQ